MKKMVIIISGIIVFILFIAMFISAYLDAHRCDKYTSYAHSLCEANMEAAIDNVEACEGRPSSCYDFYARLHKDYSACQRIDHLPTKRFCQMSLAIMLNDSSKCSLIEDSSYKDACYGDLCRKNDDLGICDQITNSTKREFYKSLVYGNFSYTPKPVEQDLNSPCYHISIPYGSSISICQRSGCDTLTDLQSDCIHFFDEKAKMSS